MRISNRQLLAGAAALMMGFGAVPAFADVKGGVDAWQRGDFAGAIREWRPLADRGDPDAQFNMGQAYRLGRGVPADLKIAQSWYQKAAAQGHEQAQANYGLMLYEGGRRTEAMSWIKKAADRGDPRSQYVLGIELSNGDLLPRDLPRAYALMMRASSQGVPAAGQALAQMDKFVPAGARQKGAVLAQQIARGAVSTPGVAKPPRVAGNVPAISQPPIASVRPVPTAAKPAAPAARVAAPAAARAAPAVVRGSGWRAQLGAYNSVSAAQAQWQVLSRKMSAISGLQPSYEKAGAFTRLRVGPFANRAAAERVCAAAKAVGQACFTVAP